MNIWANTCTSYLKLSNYFRSFPGTNTLGKSVQIPHTAKPEAPGEAVPDPRYQAVQPDALPVPLPHNPARGSDLHFKKRTHASCQWYWHTRKPRYQAAGPWRRTWKCGRAGLVKGTGKWASRTSTKALHDSRCVGSGQEMTFFTCMGPLVAALAPWILLDYVGDSLECLWIAYCMIRLLNYCQLKCTVASFYLCVIYCCTFFEYVLCNAIFFFQRRVISV